MSPKTENQPEESGWGAQDVGLVGIILISAYFIVLSAMLFYTLTVFWPSIGANTDNTAELVKYFGSSLSISAEVRMLILVVLAGAVGSLIHTVRSFSWYAGQRKLLWSWVTRYILQPFVGSALGLLFYFVIRGGFFSPNAGVQETSPFSFVAVAGLVGMFAEPAVLKLKQVAETLFARPEPGADPSPQKVQTEKEEKK